MVVNKIVEDNAYFAFRKSQMKIMNNERLGIIHVSDLIKPCIRNVMYGKFTPDEYKTMSTEDMKSLYFGQILHSASDVAEPDKHEMFLAYDYVKDKFPEEIELPEDYSKFLEENLNGFTLNDENEFFSLKKVLEELSEMLWVQCMADDEFFEFIPIFFTEHQELLTLNLNNGKIYDSYHDIGYPNWTVVYESFSDLHKVYIENRGTIFDDDCDFIKSI